MRRPPDGGHGPGRLAQLLAVEAPAVQPHGGVAYTRAAARGCRPLPQSLGPRPSATPFRPALGRTGCLGSASGWSGRLSKEQQRGAVPGAGGAGEDRAEWAEGILDRERRQLRRPALRARRREFSRRSPVEAPRPVRTSDAPLRAHAGSADRAPWRAAIAVRRGRARGRMRWKAAAAQRPPLPLPKVSGRGAGRLRPRGKGAPTRSANRSNLLGLGLLWYGAEVEAATSHHPRHSRSRTLLGLVPPEGTGLRPRLAPDISWSMSSPFELRTTATARNLSKSLRRPRGICSTWASTRTPPRLRLSRRSRRPPFRTASVCRRPLARSTWRRSYGGYRVDGVACGHQ
jgi:hypothetical protein